MNKNVPKNVSKKVSKNGQKMFKKCSKKNKEKSKKCSKNEHFLKKFMGGARQPLFGSNPLYREIENKG